MVENDYQYYRSRQLQQRDFNTSMARGQEDYDRNLKRQKEDHDWNILQAARSGDAMSIYQDLVEVEHFQIIQPQ